MPAVTQYAPGTPCWVDVTSPDMPASSAPYQGLFGWDAAGKGPESGHYTVFSLDGLDVAGLGPNPPGTVMPYWTVHLAVADTDATLDQVQAAGGAVWVAPFDVLAAKAAEFGGTVNIPPTEVATGRFAVLSDAVGAHFCIITLKPGIRT